MERCWSAQEPQVQKCEEIGEKGMGVGARAKGCERRPLGARASIERHKRTYRRFWEWRANTVQVAMLERRIETEFGWRLQISHSPNKRTLYNFPMQGNGAEMLRLAAWRMCEAGIIPNMLIHDGVLLACLGCGTTECSGKSIRGSARYRSDRACRA